jgi:hypothetical protein
MRTAYKIFVGEPEVKKEPLGVVGSKMLTWM